MDSMLDGAMYRILVGEGDMDGDAGWCHGRRCWIVPWMGGGTVSWLAKVTWSAMQGGAMDGRLDGTMVSKLGDAVDGGWYRIVVDEGGIVGKLGGAMDSTLGDAMDGGWCRILVGKGDTVGDAGWCHGWRVVLYLGWRR